MRWVSASGEAAARLHARLRDARPGWKTAAWVALVVAASTAYYAPTLRWPLVYRGSGGLHAEGGREPGDTLPIIRDVIIDDALGWAGVKRWFTDRLGRGPYGLHPGDELGREDTLRIVREATVDDQLGEVGHSAWFAEHWALRGSVYYRPMVMMSSWADYRLFGTHALGHRLTSLALHIGCCLLLGFVVGRMAKSRWPGAVAALFFAVLPDNAVVVTWIAARCELLPAVFGLGALALLLCIGPAGERARWLWPLSVLVFLMALGSKESALALPVLLGVWMLVWPVPLRPWMRGMVVLSFLAVGAGFWVMRGAALGPETPLSPPIGELLQFHVIRHYAAFIARPPVDLILAIAAPQVTASPLRADIWVLLDANLWWFLGREAVWFGAAALLLAACPAATLAFVAWKALLYLTVIPTYHFWAWPHRFYWPAMGQAALVGLAAWQAALLARRWWPRVMARLRRIEFRPTISTTV